MKQSKADVVQQLCESLTDEQWELVSKLRGLPTPENRVNFINNLFRKARSRKTAKGIARNLQQWACQKISDLLEISWGRDKEIESRVMGQSGADVRMNKNVYTRFPYTIECKSGVEWNLPKAIKQCQANLYPGTTWLIVLDRPSQKKEERIPPIVVIDGEEFFKIMGECIK